MMRKLLGTALVLSVLYVIFLIVRDNMSTEEWTAGTSPEEAVPGDAESQG